LSAQEFRGTILGRVSDTTGAVIPNVPVIVTNLSTNGSVQALSASSGNYTAPLLIPGMYRVSARKEGFKQFVRENIEVQVQDRIQIDIVLEPGVVTETVLVTAAPPLLEASSASIGGVVDQDKLISLPLNGRNPYLVARIMPGVMPTDNRSFARPFDNGATSNVSMGGNPRASNDVLLDGIPNVEASNTIAFVPSVEAVQEMRVQTNTFDAEFGRAAGGVINVTVKSGTNRFHGSLHEFWRNDILEANNFFNNRVGERKPRQRYNMFGATSGGPVYIPKVYDGRNRTFVFGSWESIRQADPNFTGRNRANQRAACRRFLAQLRRPRALPDHIRSLLHAAQSRPGGHLSARALPQQQDPAGAHGSGGAQHPQNVWRPESAWPPAQL
jgi:hypothetical protein